LTAAEIKAIEEVHQQYPELGAWNLSLLLSNEFTVHVSTMSILRVPEEAFLFRDTHPSSSFPVTQQA
jgi:hypothetical protein